MDLTISPPCPILACDRNEATETERKNSALFKNVNKLRTTLTQTRLESRFLSWGGGYTA